MAVLTHLETDTGTNVDISGATAVGAYTANGDKLIMVDVSIDAVAGNGDYVMYVTRQIGGSGSAYRILPQTTMAAASGLTAISGQSGWITVRNGDVLTCYVDGLAGDTSTPDWTTRWFESAVTLVTLADDAITAGKFDESTAYPLKSADTGNTQVARVGADGDTLETLSDQLDTAQTDLDNPSQYKADVSALALKADLAVVDENVDAIKEKTDQMAFTVPNKIDASATVDPTGIATSEELEVIGEKVDGVLDKLNVSTVQFVTSVVGSTITILRGDTLTASLLNLGSMESYVSLDFTVKASAYQSDDDAVIRIRKNASGTGDGLLRLNGAAHTTGTDGSITINDAPTGDITIMLKATVTDDLVPGTYVYDIQLIEAAEVTTLTTGSLIVSADVTRLVA